MTSPLLAGDRRSARSLAAGHGAAWGGGAAAGMMSARDSPVLGVSSVESVMQRSSMGRDSHAAGEGRIEFKTASDTASSTMPMNSKVGASLNTRYHIADFGRSSAANRRT